MWELCNRIFIFSIVSRGFALFSQDSHCFLQISLNKSIGADGGGSAPSAAPLSVGLRPWAAGFWGVREGLHV